MSQIKGITNHVVVSTASSLCSPLFNILWSRWTELCKPIVYSICTQSTFRAHTGFEKGNFANKEKTSTDFTQLLCATAAVNQTIHHMPFAFTENLRVIVEYSATNQWTPFAWNVFKRAKSLIALFEYRASFSDDHNMLRSAFSGKETSNMISSNFSLEVKYCTISKLNFFNMIGIAIFKAARVTFMKRFLLRTTS